MTKKNTNSNSRSPAEGNRLLFQLLMPFFQRSMLFLERRVEWMLRLVTWLPWTLLAGMLPGVVIWQSFHSDQLRSFFQNEITVQPTVTIWAAVSCVLYIAACFGAHRRISHLRHLRFAAFCQQVNRFTAALLVIPITFFFRLHPISKNAPIFTMLLCLIAGIIAAVVVYGIPRLSAILSPREEKQGPLILLVVITLAAIWAWTIIRLEMTHHTALGTSDWDFGLYINTMWNSIHGNFLDCSLNSAGNHAYLHFDPILILFSPVLLIYPGPESLMVVQGAWIASGAIPLYLLASHLGKNRWLGLIMAVVYLLHPAFHGPAMYDFHSLMLAGPLMLWSMLFLEKGAPRRFFIFFVLLLLTREDMIAIGLLIGLYAFISGKSRSVAIGALVLASLYGLVVYFAIVLHGHSYSGYFKDMQGESRPVLANIALTAIANPLFMLKHMLTERKLIYILQLIVPLLFLPVFARKHLLLYMGGLAITLVGTKNCLSSISMQYSTWWLPFMLAAIPTAIDTVSHGRIATIFRLNAVRFRGALLAGVLLSTFTMSVAYGAFWPNISFRAGYSKLVRHLDEDQEKRFATVKKIKKMIPDDASVMASQHLVPHFAIRDKIWSIDRKGYRVGEPDYAIVWKRDLRSKKEYKVKNRKKNLMILRDSRRYRRILKENDITVYMRKSQDTTRD